MCEKLQPLVTDRTYKAYKNMIDVKNSNYGTHTWTVLGLRFLYSILFAKYLRYVESRSEDSMVDFFGYCVIAMVYTKNHYSYIMLNDDTSVTEQIDDFIDNWDLANAVSFVDEGRINIDELSVQGLFEDDFEIFNYNLTNNINSEEVVDFILRLLLYMSVEEVVGARNIGQYF